MIQQQLLKQKVTQKYGSQYEELDRVVQSWIRIT